MEKIPTAEEFVLKYNSSEQKDSLMVAFAKMHVIEALEWASGDAEAWVIGGLVAEVNKDSILNSYPLENIK